MAIHNGVALLVIVARMLNWLKRPPDFVIQDNYLLRWYIIPHNRWFNIYLHNIRHSDDDHALHDHPWHNVSIILKGGYIEQSWNGEKEHTRGAVIFRKATRRHRLIIPDGGETWTLFITGPKIREWGFWCPKGFVHWKDFVDMSNPGKVGPGCGD